MNKKLQVFVSSTYTDLIEERQAAVAAILDAGHIPAGMELFKAGKSQMKTIRKWIDESDVYMLILGGRYGSIEEESGLSYTELEYKYALSKNMPVFAIVLDDSFLHIKASSAGDTAIFGNKNKQKYKVFKKFVETNVVKFVSNVDQIPSFIHGQLNYILSSKEYNLIGWIRDDTFTKNSTDTIGNYAYNDLLNIFQSKKFKYNNTNALNTFIKYYRNFCTGIDYYEYTADPLVLAANDNYYLYKEICPFFMGFDLIYYSAEKQKYRITKNGSYFYSLLEINKQIP